MIGRIKSASVKQPPTPDGNGHGEPKPPTADLPQVPPVPEPPPTPTPWAQYLADNPNLVWWGSAAALTIKGVTILTCILITAVTLLMMAVQLNAALVICGGAGLIAWGCGYWLTIQRELMERNPIANSIENDPIFEPSRYIHQLSTIMMVLFGTLTLVLILAQYEFLDEFLVAGPMLLIFPFIYFAYSTFQRKLRIVRLKREFKLLGAFWDDNLARQSLGFAQFIIYIILVMSATILGLVIMFSPQLIVGVVDGAASINIAMPIASLNIPLSVDTLQAMRYGFIGAYLFVIQMIYRRYTTYDLLPQTFLAGAIFILLGIGLAYVFFQTGTLSSVNFIVGPLQISGGFAAFLLGFLPPLTLRVITRLAFRFVRRIFGQWVMPRADQLSLSYIDGISIFHELRLNDTGIDNIQNLADADIPALLTNSAFSVQQVLDWVDQALLYVYCYNLDIEIPPYSKAHIRTLTDFRDIWKNAYLRPPALYGQPPKQEILALVKDTREERAKLFKFTVKDDKGKKGTMPASPLGLDLLYEASTRGPNVVYIEHYWDEMDRVVRNGGWYKQAEDQKKA